MKLSDLLHLPPGALLAFAVLIWPAVWAAFLIIVSLSRDLRRQSKERPTDVWHKAA